MQRSPFPTRGMLCCLQGLRVSIQKPRKRREHRLSNPYAQQHQTLWSIPGWTVFKLLSTRQTTSRLPGSSMNNVNFLHIFYVFLMVFIYVMFWKLCYKYIRLTYHNLKFSTYKCLRQWNNKHKYMLCFQKSL